MKAVLLRTLCMLEIFYRGRPHRYERIHDEEWDTALVCARCGHVKDIEFYEDVLSSLPTSAPPPPPRASDPYIKWNDLWGNMTPPLREVASVRKELKKAMAD